MEERSRHDRSSDRRIAFIIFHVFTRNPDTLYESKIALGIFGDRSRSGQTGFYGGVNLASTEISNL